MVSKRRQKHVSQSVLLNVYTHRKNYLIKIQKLMNFRKLSDLDEVSILLTCMAAERDPFMSAMDLSQVFNLHNMFSSFYFKTSFSRQVFMNLIVLTLFFELPIG